MLFLYKPDFQFQKAKVEKKVCLPAGEFEEFLKNPLGDMPCIVENIDLMQEDQEGIYHCLLVTGEGPGVLPVPDFQKEKNHTLPVPDPDKRSSSRLSFHRSQSGSFVQQKDEGQTMEACLKDLLCARWENLHLVHDEIDYGLPHTIVELW